MYTPSFDYLGVTKASELYPFNSLLSRYIYAVGHVLTVASAIGVQYINGIPWVDINTYTGRPTPTYGAKKNSVGLEFVREMAPWVLEGNDIEYLYNTSHIRVDEVRELIQMVRKCEVLLDHTVLHLDDLKGDDQPSYVQKTFAKVAELRTFDFMSGAL